MPSPAKMRIDYVPAQPSVLANSAKTSSHAMQAAFIGVKAAQCSFCTNGMVMEAAMNLVAKPQHVPLRLRRSFLRLR